MEKLIYLIYPLLLILLLAKSKFYYQKGTFNDEVMSLEQTKMLQGFVAVLILFHHMSQKVSANWINPRYIRPGMEFFVDIGYLCVGIFFFCSGYGLFKSYKTKENYFNGFFKRRILPIIIAFYTSEVTYLIVRFLIGEKISPRKFFEYLIGIRMANPNAWYAMVIPLFYLFFYLAFKNCKKDSMAIFIVWMLVLAYTILGTYINHNEYLMRGEWWYNSVHLFPIGMVFAKTEEKTLDRFKKFYWIKFILFFVLTIVLFYAAIIAGYIFSYYYGENGLHIIASWETVWRRWVCLLFQVLASTALCYFVIILQMKLKLNNKVLAFFGGMTLEFYLMHGLFVHLFCFEFDETKKTLYFIKNPFIYVIVVCILSVPCAYLYKKLNTRILKLFSKEK